MRALKLIFGILLFSGWIYFIGSGHQIGNSPLPPLGKFLDPFHGYLQNGESSDPDFNSSISVPGLSEPVKILYDTNMVPHIYAENDHDLCIAQGYLTASLRLWQMDLQSRSASGRISEIMGSKALNLDRETRRKGLVYGGEKIREVLKRDHPDVWDKLEAYSIGVNAYIQSLSYVDYPIEYKLLNYEPEAWDPFNTVLLIQYMNDLLGGWDNDVESTNFAALFGEDVFDSLFFSSFQDPIIPKKEWDFESIALVNDSIELDTFELRERFRSDPANGSNNWAISGAKTLSGNPILSNDTHLRLWLPALWNMIHLHSPQTNTAGFVFSGAPGIIIGYNDSISWAFTNGPRDQRDWYKIQFRDETKEEYFHDDQWKKTRLRIEEIDIKGEDPFIDSVYYTHHGPVVFDDNYGGNGSRVNLAFRWIGHEPSGIINAIWNMNKAHNYTEYKRALETWDSPAQNAVFASSTGDIAMRVAGTFPLKWEKQGVYVMDGTNPAHDWQGFIPHEQNAFQLNPDRNFVSSANQYPTDPSYPYFVYNASHEQYRNRIINRLLTAVDSAEVIDMKEMQFNRYNILAEELLPLLADSLDSASLNATELIYLQTLEKWDFQYLPNLSQPVLMEYWWRYLYSDLWDELRHESYPLPRPSSFNTYQLLRDGLVNKWLDKAGTDVIESFSDLVTINFKRAVSAITKREEDSGETLTWAAMNNVRLTHMSTQLAAFDSERLDIGGSGSVIMAANGGHGPSQRMVVEMSTPPKAYFSLPGGLSGNPGSSLYMNYLPDYVSGEYIQVKLSIEESSAKHIQLLNPDK